MRPLGGEEGCTSKCEENSSLVMFAVLLFCVNFSVTYDCGWKRCYIPSKNKCIHLSLSLHSIKLVYAVNGFFLNRNYVFSPGYLYFALN